MSTIPDIKYLFEPRSVAVIGASHDPSKIGIQVRPEHFRLRI